MKFTNVILAFICVISSTCFAQSKVLTTPTIEAKQVDSHRIQVNGRNFGHNSRIVIEADSDTPHASLSGYSQRTRLVLIKSGSFQEKIVWDREDRGGQFACGETLEKSNWFVTAETTEGKLLAKSNALVCPQKSAMGN